MSYPHPTSPRSLQKRSGLGNFELGKISFMWLFNKLCIFSYRFVYLARYCLDENEIGFQCILFGISGVSEMNQP